MTGSRIPRRSPEQCRQIVLSLVDDSGTKTEHIHAALGFKCARNTLGVLSDMRQRGEICNAKAALDGARRTDAYWFLTTAARDEFFAAYKVIWKQRRLAAQVAWRENEAAKRPPRPGKVKPPQPPQPVKMGKAATVSRAKKVRTPPKPKTRRDNAIAEMLHRHRAAEDRQPERVKAQTAPVITEHTKITRAAPAPSRWAVQPPAAGGFSHLKPGQYEFEPASCAAGARHQLEMEVPA